MASKINYSLTQIEYVLAVHKYGHFSQAAKECHVTQPTLSMQIKKLEEELGIVIFDRTKKPILLTEKGAQVLEQMKAVLAEARKIDEILSEAPDGEVAGELTIGIIPTVAPYLLPALIPSVAKLFPKLRLKILELQTHRIVQSLEDDQIDVGILATPLKLPKIHERPLYLEPFSLLCQKGHKIASRGKVDYGALDPNDIWLLEEGHCLRHQVLDICEIRKRKNVTRPFQFESGSLETLKSLVSTYGGYTLLPALANQNLPANTHTVSFGAPVPAREIGLVTGRIHHKKNLQEALVKAILEAIPPAIRKLRREDLDLVPVS